MQHSSQSKTWDEWLTHKPFSGYWNTPHKLELQDTSDQLDNPVQN